jgi:hypothetical protein
MISRAATNRLVLRHQAKFGYKPAAEATVSIEMTVAIVSGAQAKYPKFKSRTNLVANMAAPSHQGRPPFFFLRSCHKTSALKKKNRQKSR